LTFASTACLRRKLIGTALGVGALIAANLMHLVHLFLLGVHRPALFDVWHAVVWELILIMTTLGLWGMWRRWAMRSHLEGKRHGGD
jgi:exosortase/archaeosortase family protein